MTAIQRVTSLWPQDLGDPEVTSVLTSTLVDHPMRERKMMMQGVIVLPDRIGGERTAPLLDLRLVPLALLKEDMLKRDPMVLQYPGSQCPGHQRTKHSSLDLEQTRLELSLT